MQIMEWLGLFGRIKKLVVLLSTYALLVDLSDDSTSIVPNKLEQLGISFPHLPSIWNTPCIYMV